ncbi:MAG: hypothetical protein HY320_09170 [Armatimonadetes bacterium]|nr:hypothetical protein [Armatimonadota bacterium]
MLEIAFQVRFLCSDPAQQEDRASRYLAWFWLQAEHLPQAGVPASRREWWLAHCHTHRHLVTRPTGSPFRNWWGDTPLRDIARDLGLQGTYDEDYRFLSQMAHGTAQGHLYLFRPAEGGIEVRSDVLVPEMLVFGTRYVLGVAVRWQEHFGVVTTEPLCSLAQEAVEFDLRRLPPNRPAE